jgi:uncharacterized membrane protein
LLAAVATDWFDLVAGGPAWLAPMAVTTYGGAGLGAAVAYWTGSVAADTVFIPGMAHPFIEEHGSWALAATLAIVALALVRGAIHLLRTSRPTLRWVTAIAALGVVVLVQQTAERGGRLVYEHGVGVIAAPPQSR